MKTFKVIAIVVFLICGKLWAQANPMFLGFEQRVMVSYILQSAGLPDEDQEILAKRASQFLNSVKSRELQEIKVNSFEEFLSLWRGSWPNTHKLDLDLQIIESDPSVRWRAFRSDRPEVQGRIDHYLKEQQELLVGFLLNHRIPVDNKLVMHAFNFLNGSMDQSQGQEQEKQIQLTKDVFKDSSPFVLSYMDEIEKVATDIAKDPKNFGSEKGIQRIIQLFIGGYFKELNLDAKKQAASLLLELPMQSSSLERFGAIVGAAGPQLQKLLQILAREKNMNPKLREVFRSLEANVRPVPWILVSKILDSEKSNFEFVDVETLPIGVGTMAQVHRGRLRLGPEIKEVVVRFLKPGIETRVAEDREILRKLAPSIDADPLVRADNLPKVVPIVDDLARTISEELIFKNTIERQKIAINVYRGENKKLFKGYDKVLYLSVPLVFEPKSEGSKLLVQEFVSGKKLDEIASTVASEMPNFKTLVVEELARVWIREVLLGTGFYHADLHQGNFKVSVGNHEVHLNILDFGMSGVLSKNLQLNFMKLGAGVDLLKDEAMASAFWDLSEKDKNKIDERTFRDSVFEEVHKIKNGAKPNKKFHEWIAYAMDLGISLPYDFINLNRGYVILSKLLEETGSGYNMSILAKRTGFQKPVTVATMLFRAGDIGLFDMLKMASRGIFRSKPSPVEDVIVESKPIDDTLDFSHFRCAEIFTGGK